ncbi:MAG: WXG100 family type VII secretion target [Lachnospiraceae bacterium]|nr:WXG100 family type VII secretion target [Lachnospiraceae bacterium]
MAGTIRITPESLRSNATKVDGYRSEFDGTMSNLQRLVDNLGSEWEGQAQAAFNNDFQNMKKTITSFSQCLQRYADAMRTAAAELEQADQNLKSKMSGSTVG